MISNRELADMRLALKTLMPDTCHILSTTNTSDGEGGIVQTWGTAVKNVRCRLDSFLSAGLASMRGGGEMVAGGAVAEYSRWILSVPHDTAVTEINRIEMHDGNVYNIVSMDSGKSWNAELRLTVEKV
jgi:hypothetical protein